MTYGLHKKMEDCNDRFDQDTVRSVRFFLVLFSLSVRFSSAESVERRVWSRLFCSKQSDRPSVENVSSILIDINSSESRMKNSRFIFRWSFFFQFSEVKRLIKL